MSENERWGFGDGDPKPFASSKMDDGSAFTLHQGEHPHTRHDGKVYAKFDNGSVEAFDGHRTLVDIQLRTFNYLKCSVLSGNEVRKGGQFRIRLNGMLVWCEFFREAGSGLVLAQQRLTELLGLPVRFWDGEQFQGRKVWWCGHPAVVAGFSCDENESNGNRLELKAENGRFPKQPWHDGTTGEITDNTLSPYIWWFRGQA